MTMRQELALLKSRVARLERRLALLEGVNHARVGTKSWQIGELLRRPQGCTTRQVLRKVGWPTVSMPQQARICGLRLVRQRRGRNVRYFAA